jgi:hypothetical protein
VLAEIPDRKTNPIGTPSLVVVKEIEAGLLQLVLALISSGKSHIEIEDGLAGTHDSEIVRLTVLQKPM